MGAASTNLSASAITLTGQLQTYIYNQDIDALRRGEIPNTSNEK